LPGGFIIVATTVFCKFL